MTTWYTLEAEAQDYLLGVDRDLSMSDHDLFNMRETANLIFNKAYLDSEALLRLAEATP